METDKKTSLPADETVIPVAKTDDPTNDNVTDGTGLIPPTHLDVDDGNYHPDPDDFDEGDYEDIDDIGEGKKI